MFSERLDKRMSVPGICICFVAPFRLLVFRRDSSRQGINHHTSSRELGRPAYAPMASQPHLHCYKWLTYSFWLNSTKTTRLVAQLFRSKKSPSSKPATPNQFIVSLRVSYWGSGESVTQGEATTTHYSSLKWGDTLWLEIGSRTLWTLTIADEEKP